MYKLKQISILILSLITTSFSKAQVSINTSGGDINGIGGNVSYSFGQVSYSNFFEASGKLTEGVQQPYEIFTLEINEKNQNVAFKVFPNPTTGIIFLEKEGNHAEKYTFELSDILGNLLLSQNLSINSSYIDLSVFPPSVYYITIYDEQNRKVHSFKIIKN